MTLLVKRTLKLVATGFVFSFVFGVLVPSVGFAHPETSSTEDAPIIDHPETE